MESVVCGSCQFNIGKVIMLYKFLESEIKLDYLNKSGKVLGDKESISVTSLTHDHSMNTLEFKNLLDLLDVKNECCRSAVLTSYVLYSPE